MTANNINKPTVEPIASIGKFNEITSLYSIKFINNMPKNLDNNPPINIPLNSDIPPINRFS